MRTLKSNIRRNNILLCIVLATLFVFSCQKDNEPEPINEYLVDYSLILTFPAGTIENSLSLMTGLYPELSDFLSKVEYDVQIYRIRYKTRYKDSVITASGLVCVPVDNKAFPLISFQNGTNTLHSNAPSVNPTNNLYLIMEFMATTGYIILITDYIGFGSSSDIVHPYYQRSATNNSVIDLIRAYEELDKSGNIMASGNDSLFLMGYSQGGGATISVLDEIEHSDPFDMNVIAVSAGAGAYDLTQFTNYVLNIETFPSPSYFPYFIYSQQKYGNIGGSLDVYFNQPYADIIPALFDGLHSGGEINNALSVSISQLMTENMINNFESAEEFGELRTSLIENSVEGWNTGVRINLYHGTDDLHVPPQQSLSLYTSFIGAGSDMDNVKYFPLPGLMHDTGLIPWGILSINWFDSFKQ